MYSQPVSKGINAVQTMSLNSGQSALLKLTCPPTNRIVCLNLGSFGAMADWEVKTGLST